MIQAAEMVDGGSSEVSMNSIIEHDEKFMGEVLFEGSSA